MHVMVHDFNFWNIPQRWRQQIGTCVPVYMGRHPRGQWFSWQYSLFVYMQIMRDVSSFLRPLAWTSLLLLLLWCLSCFESHSLVTAMIGLSLSDWFLRYLSMLYHLREYVAWNETITFGWTGIEWEHRCLFFSISLVWHLHGVTEENCSKLQSTYVLKKRRFKLYCRCKSVLSWSLF
jgi:hypothetical protein